MARLHAKLKLLGKHPKEIPVRTSPFLLGRSEECHLALTGGGKVSRKHAEIKYASGRFSIADLGSHNGTSVNGEKITECDLDDGDRITIGGFEMEVAIIVEDKAGERQPAPRLKRKGGHRHPGAEHGKEPPSRSRHAHEHKSPERHEEEAPAVVTVPAPEESGTRLVDMAAYVGPPQGEGGTAIVDMTDLTGGRKKPSKRFIFGVAAVAVVLSVGVTPFLFPPPPQFSFQQRLELVGKRAAGEPVPPDVPLPTIEPTFDLQTLVRTTTERPVIFPIDEFGSTDPNVFQVAGIGTAEEGGPEKLAIQGQKAGKALLVMVDHETKKWYSIEVQVVEDARWPPNWNDSERRATADKLKADADEIYVNAKKDLTDRSKALSRYSKVVRLYESMGSAPAKPLKEAKDRVEEIQREITRVEDELMRQYKAALGRKKWEEVYQLVGKLLELYPVENVDRNRDDEVAGKHGNWEKFNLYKAERNRIESILRKIDPRRTFR
ncbi:MAG: FHA domain-containing protein [Planctomycetes bacterium]|nr:FHA domain-containing protein [Planctomycetota bacterium]